VGAVCEVQKVRKVKEAEKDGDVDGRNIVIRIPAALVPCVVPKGSIAIDGVSLTVAAVDGDRATIALVPHTLTHTTLGQLRQNARVNLETDVLVRALVWRKDAGVS
jgi:riboflavin synthase alpha subunit